MRLVAERWGERVKKAAVFPFFAVLAVLMPSLTAVAQQAEPNGRVPSGETACARSAIHFDASSIEAITLRPEEILRDVDAFWENDRAYWLVSRWLEEVGASLPTSMWLPHIERKAQVPGAERNADEFLTLTRDLMAREDAFLGDAIPHICSFIPDGAVDMTAGVYFTTLIPQNAFQKHFSVVMNVSHPEWMKSPSTIMNTLVHELFHVAFYRWEPLMTEVQDDNSEKYDVLLNLMNEGMATYVAYTALPTYPAIFRDYALLDNPHEVRRSIRAINALLSSVDSLSPDEFRQRMFTVGVRARGLYVVGGNAARTIEQAGGRAMLLDAMRRGPRAFVSVYNSLAGEDERLVEYPLPAARSPFQRMQQAALAGALDSMRQAMADIRAQCAAGCEAVGHALHTTGHLLLHRRELDAAIEVFELYRELLPHVPNPYEGLATAYLMRGDRERAAAMCHKLLEVSPGHVAALDMLAELGEPRSPPSPTF